MKTMELTVRLPEEEAHFLETYAKERAISLAELLARYARRLQHRPPHPANLNFTGTVPAKVEAREEHRQQAQSKHR